MADLWTDPKLWGDAVARDAAQANLWNDPKLWGDHVATKEDVTAQQQEDAQAVPDESKFGHLVDYISDSAIRGVSSLPGTVADVVKDVGTGVWNLAKGGLHGDVSTIVPKHFPGFDTGSQAVQQAVNQQLGAPVQPQNTFEKYLGALVGGAAAGAASLNPEGILAGAMSGVGGQAGSDLVPGSEWAPFLGSLVVPGLSHTGLHALIRHLEGGGSIEHPLISPKGAVGPMQVMPATAEDPSLGVKSWDGTPQDRVRLGNDYADALNKRYGGDEEKVLAAYNAGFGRVDELISKYGENWKDHLPSETKDYLARAGKGSTGESVPPIDPDQLAKIMGDQQNTQELGQMAENLVHPSPDLTPAEQQEMDASVPKVIPPEAVDARTVGQGADYPEQIPANDTGGREPPQEPPSDGSMAPEDKLAIAINEARPANLEQQELLHNLRVNQNAKLAEIQARNGSVGEMKAALKSDLPVTEFEPLDHGLTEEEVNSLRRQINSQRGIGTFDKVHAHEALDKLLDPEGMRVPTESELDTLSGIFGPNLVSAIRERVSPTTDPGFFNKAWNTVNAAKTIGDWSDLTKSNATMFLTPGYWKTLGNLVKGGFFSEENYKKIRAVTRSHPNYDLVRQMNISHTGPGEALGEHEEIFKQNFLEHVPGLKTAMRASERVYSGVANENRDASALGLLARDQRAGIDVTDPTYLKNAGELINTLTGRASFGRSKLGIAAERAMPFISKVLWTPRQYASWVKMAAYAVNPKWWMKASPAMRMQLASGVLSLAGWTIANLAIASALGYEVHKNVLDPLFGKYKIGDTVYDASAGRGSTIHAIATAISGYVLKDGEVQSLGDNPHANLKSRSDVVMHWLRTHASPAAAMIENEFSGKDLTHPVNAIGHAEDWTDWKSRMNNPLYQAATPMAAEGTLDAADHYGWNNKQTYLTGGGEMIGIQANTREERPAKSALWDDPKLWEDAKPVKSALWDDPKLWGKQP